MPFILLIQISLFFLYIVIILATVVTLLCHFQTCPEDLYLKCFCEGHCWHLTQCLYDFWSFQQVVLFCGIQHGPFVCSVKCSPTCSLPPLGQWPRLQCLLGRLSNWVLPCFSPVSPMCWEETPATNQLEGSCTPSPPFGFLTNIFCLVPVYPSTSMSIVWCLLRPCHRGAWSLLAFSNIWRVRILGTRVWLCIILRVERQSSYK